MEKPSGDIAIFTVDPMRQCRARGHSYESYYRQESGTLEAITSSTCFRCGTPLTENMNVH